MHQPVAPAHPDASHGRTPRRAMLASWIGSALEYYDFAVYGTAAALVLNHLFFPDSTAPGIAILLSLGTVGVAYFVRPLGALLMGPLGDRLGRRFVLMLTLFAMGGATFAVGCLPTYDQVGFLAPALLVLCRLIQGLSASGEQASAISVSLEHADDHRRGFTTSWTLQGTQFGTLLATGVFIPFTFLLTEDQLFSWGWRIPFWLSAVVVVVAWIIRRRLEEPPAFEAAVEESASTRGASPITLAFRFHKAAMLRVAAAAMINTVNVVFLVWSLSFATSVVKLDRATMLWVSVAANALALLVIPLAGTVADRVGRKPVFMAGVIGSAIMVYPYLAAVAAGNWALIFLLGVVMSGLLYSLANAVWPSFYAEMFPIRVRVTGLALGTQVGFAVSGGLTPIIAGTLAGTGGGNWVAVGILVTVACLISLVAAITAKETASLSLRDIDAVHTSRTEAAVAAGADTAPVPGGRAQ
ncbi:MFS transporter [Tersicoccus solisilvae]|uniref:MFS transporter n=1 Tax=Tersicoccus solisilvae TaxID=1882339 RepID=A0ABQ1NQU9_9MICC|nr:MFS transporter [Tersicoccus solisilvae]GGC83059.1 MFS transporter [Tersicoccus solisilvae]